MVTSYAILTIFGIETVRIMNYNVMSSSICTIARITIRMDQTDAYFLEFVS